MPQENKSLEQIIKGGLAGGMILGFKEGYNVSFSVGPNKVADIEVMAKSPNEAVALASQMLRVDVMKLKKKMDGAEEPIEEAEA